MVLIAACIGGARAQEISTGELLGRRAVPAAVRDQVTCNTNPDAVTRHPFAGGYLFAWDCGTRFANSMQALVYADGRDGTGARLLRFPHFGDKPGADGAGEVANKRLFPASGDIIESLIDPESTGFCRTENRWRVMGQPKRAWLVSVRQTRDCRGVGGWVGVLPKDVTGEVTRGRIR